MLHLSRSGGWVMLTLWGVGWVQLTIWAVGWIQLESKTSQSTSLEFNWSQSRSRKSNWSQSRSNQSIDFQKTPTDSIDFQRLQLESIDFREKPEPPQSTSRVKIWKVEREFTSTKVARSRKLSKVRSSLHFASLSGPSCQSIALLAAFHIASRRLQAATSCFSSTSRSRRSRRCQPTSC